MVAGSHPVVKPGIITMSNHVYARTYVCVCVLISYDNVHIQIARIE